jgi:hypothetical protein
VAKGDELNRLFSACLANGGERGDTRHAVQIFVNFINQTDFQLIHMRKTLMLLFFALVMFRAYPQDNGYYDLPVEFKNVAAQAFEKVSPVTKQWFTDIAIQHPPGAFDTLWAKKKVREKFGTNVANQDGELFMLMIAYQRMLNKEVRDDRKISTASKQLNQANKENKLKMDNKSIDQSMKEADQKAATLQQGANVALVTGIVSGTVQMSNAYTAAQGKNNSLQTNQNISAAKLTPVKFQQIDSSKLKLKNTNASQQVREEAKEKADAEETKKASEDHNQAMKDAVKKLLDQMAEMGRSIKL